MVVIEPGMSVLTVCENGYGKRTDVEEYRLDAPRRQGRHQHPATERNGPVVALRAVTDDDSLILITAGGNLYACRSMNSARRLRHAGCASDPPRRRRQGRRRRPRCQRPEERAVTGEPEPAPEAPPAAENGVPPPPNAPDNGAPELQLYAGWACVPLPAVGTL